MAEDRKVTTTLEEANEVGLLGVEVDPTPNEHYTVAGVIAGKPTPETDADAASTAGVTFGRGSAAEESTRPRSSSRSKAAAKGGDNT